MLKLSEAILAGHAAHPEIAQVHGTFWRYDNDTVCAACAVGLGLIGAGLARADARNWEPNMPSEWVERDGRGGSTPIDAAAYLNDYICLSFTEIAAQLARRGW